MQENDSRIVVIKDGIFTGGDTSRSHKKIETTRRDTTRKDSYKKGERYSQGNNRYKKLRGASLCHCCQRGEWDIKTKSEGDIKNCAEEDEI